MPIINYLIKKNVPKENYCVGRENDIRTDLFQSVIAHVRENHKEAIDKAYAYFWDDQTPDEFLKGTALSIAFMNFEDWLVCDYRVNEDRETFIDIFRKCRPALTEEETDLLHRMRESVISLYEVKSVSKDKHVMLIDLLMDREIALRDKALTKGLKKGDIFAARLLQLDGKDVMSGCVYPYRKDQKKTMLKQVDKQFSRYKRNVNPEGTMRDFLKDYGDVLNIIWMNQIMS